MRTRRIAIGCRRTGNATTVAIATAGSAATADLLPVDLVPMDFPIGSLIDPPGTLIGPPGASSPLDFGEREASRAVPTQAQPSAPPANLTLADLTGTARRDIGWNRNPGWPDEVGWTHIAHTARGRSPRHARSLLTLPSIPQRAFTWTGLGVGAALAVTVLATAVSELVR